MWLENWKWLTCLQRSGQFLPLLLFARKQIVAKGLNTPFRETEKLRKIQRKIYLFRTILVIMVKIINVNDIMNYSWYWIKLFLWNSIHTNFTVSQRLETVTVRISMENFRSSPNSRLSTTGVKRIWGQSFWNSKKINGPCVLNYLWCWWINGFEEQHL